MIRKSGVALISSALLVMGLATSAMAKDIPSSGLGQSWPTATDVSTTPHWHVYVFQKDGIRYIQVNDLNGAVQGAIATAGGQILVLPIGASSQYVKVANLPGRGGETVYSDDEVAITAVPLSNGATQFTATATCTGDPVECNSHLTTSTATPSLTTQAATTTATCTGDPVECNSHLATMTATPMVTTQASTSTATCTGDPVECNSHLTTTTAAPSLTTQAGTAAATCTGDPVECNSHLTTTAAPSVITKASTAAATCTGDPVECNSHLTTTATTSSISTQPQASTTTATCTGDPVECNSHVSPTPSH